MEVAPCTIYENHDQQANRIDVSLVVPRHVAEHISGISANAQPTLYLQSVRALATRWQRNGAAETQLKVFKLRNILAADAMQTVSSLWRDDDILELGTDMRSNSLIVRGDKRGLAEIEALLLRLDAASARSSRVPETTVDPSAADKNDQPLYNEGDARTADAELQGIPVQSVLLLRKRFNELEARTQDLARRLRVMKTGPGPQQAKDRLRNELREAVRESLEARQELQRAELAEFQRRMRRIERSITLRDRIADQIIDRRVEELLNPTPNVETVKDAVRRQPKTDAAEARGRLLVFNFRNQAWKEVLEWFASQQNLSLVIDAMPPGTFTYSVSEPMTLSEVLRLLNDILLPKGYALVVGKDKLRVVRTGRPDES